MRFKIISRYKSFKIQTRNSPMLDLFWSSLLQRNFCDFFNFYTLVHTETWKTAKGLHRDASCNFILYHINVFRVKMLIFSYVPANPLHNNLGQTRQLLLIAHSGFIKVITLKYEELSKNVQYQTSLSESTIHFASRHMANPTC